MLAGLGRSGRPTSKMERPEKKPVLWLDKKTSVRARTVLTHTHTSTSGMLKHGLKVKSISFITSSVAGWWSWTPAFVRDFHYSLKIKRISCSEQFTTILNFQLLLFILWRCPKANASALEYSTLHPIQRWNHLHNKSSPNFQEFQYIFRASGCWKSLLIKKVSNNLIILQLSRRRGSLPTQKWTW